MIVVPSSAGESDNESLPSEEEGGQLEYLEGGQHVQQMQQLTAAGYSPQTPFAHAQAQPLLSTGGVKTPASATAPGSSRLQAGSVPSAELFASGNKGLEGRARLEEVEEEVRRLRQKESEKEREVEILKSLLVDQEQQVRVRLLQPFLLICAYLCLSLLLLLCTANRGGG